MRQKDVADAIELLVNEMAVTRHAASQPATEEGPDAMP